MTCQIVSTHKNPPFTIATLTILLLLLLCVHLCIYIEIEVGNAVNEYAKGYMNSEEYKCLQQQLSPILDKARKNPVGSAPNYANNLFWQVTTMYCSMCKDLQNPFL